MSFRDLIASSVIIGCIRRAAPSSVAWTALAAFGAAVSRRLRKGVRWTSAETPAREGSREYPWVTAVADDNWLAMTVERTAASIPRAWESSVAHRALRPGLAQLYGLELRDRVRLFGWTLAVAGVVSGLIMAAGSTKIGSVPVTLAAVVVALGAGLTIGGDVATAAWVEWRIRRPRHAERSLR